MDYEYEGSWEGDDEDVPYVALELDITDVHTHIVLSVVLLMIARRSSIGTTETTTMKDFLYRIVLEYKYKVQE